MLPIKKTSFMVFHGTERDLMVTKTKFMTFHCTWRKLAGNSQVIHLNNM